MADGEVDTPAGKMMPPLRTFDAQGGRAPDKKELPSAGTVFPLAPGLNRMAFTGQWLINWDLYVLTGEPQQAHIGNWGHFWHPGPEQAEFEAAQGRPFEERQHILRIKGNGAFQVLILPYRKGEPREGEQVSQEGDQVRITSATSETVIGADFYAFSRGDQKGLATFGAQRAEAHGLAAEGGGVELVVEGPRAKVTLHGLPGRREVVLPGSWEVHETQGLKGVPEFNSGVWILDYEGGDPITIRFAQKTDANS